MKITQKIKGFFTKKKKEILFLSSLQFTKEQAIRIMDETGYIVILTENPKEDFAFVSKNNLDEKKSVDGKAVFLSDGTHEDFLEYEREQKGLDKWYKRIKNM